MKRSKKSTPQQRKERLLIVLLAIVAVGLLVFCVNASNQNAAGNVVAQADTTVTTTAPTTTQATTVPTTQAPAETTTEAPSQADQTTTEAVTESTTQAVTEPADETAEILKVVFDSVNLLKSEEANFTGKKVQSINLKLVDSSVPSVNNIVNSVLSGFIKDETLEYDFTNGVSPDPKGDGTVVSNNIFPPGYKPFELTEDGVASATKTMDGENTVYTIVIVPETSTLENPRPPYHNAAADTLDLSSVEIPIITLTRVDFDYPGDRKSVV